MHPSLCAAIHVKTSGSHASGRLRANAKMEAYDKGPFFIVPSGVQSVILASCPPTCKQISSFTSRIYRRPVALHALRAAETNRPRLSGGLKATRRTGGLQLASGGIASSHKRAIRLAKVAQCSHVLIRSCQTHGHQDECEMMADCKERFVYPWAVDHILQAGTTHDVRAGLGFAAQNCDL